MNRLAPGSFQLHSSYKKYGKSDARKPATILKEAKRFGEGDALGHRD